MAWKDPPILNSAICFPCTSTTLPEPEVMSAISHAFSSCSMAYFASQFFNANGHLKLQHRQWRLGSGLLQFVDHFGRQVQVGLGDQRIGILADDRLACVAALRHPWVDRYFAQERHARVGGKFLASTMAKDLVALAIFVHKIAHVFHDADYWHAHLPEHLQPSVGNGLAHFLWHGDD